MRIEATIAEAKTEDGNSLSGVLTKISFHRDGFLIGRLNNGYAIKGSMAAPQLGLTYRFKGKFSTHPKYGPQFAFDSYSSELPRSPQAIKDYIDKARWVGPAIAESLVACYGERTLEALKENPEDVAARIAGITDTRAQEIAAFLRANEENEATELTLRDALVGVQIGKATFNKILKYYGSDAAAVVSADPYRLARDIDGVSFIIADKIARKHRIPLDDRRRIIAGIRHVLEDASFGTGHTFLPRSELSGDVKDLLGIPRAKVAEVLKDIEKECDIVDDEGFPEDYIADDASEHPIRTEPIEDLFVTRTEVALRQLREDEAYIAEKLPKLKRSVDPVAPTIAQLDGLADDQIEAVHHALTHGVSVVHGAGGTGKSTTIERIIMAFPADAVALCAPSGKAARRISELTRRPARTIHMLLEASVDPRGFVFTRHEANPLPHSVIVVDEVSMCDVSIFAALLRATELGTRLVLIGDPHQLPSVGPGNVLKDLIASKAIPTTELTTIKRQRPGLIIQNGIRIRHGQDVSFETDDDDARDLQFFEADSAEDAQRTIVSQVMMYAKAFDEPLRSIQVLSALREKTILSVKTLNEKLRVALNKKNRPQEVSLEKIPFWLGDKVIQTKNDYKAGVMNGDIGFLTAVNTANVTVAFDDPERIVSFPTWDNKLSLAYAITTHKFQGSQAPIVIVVVHPILGPLVQTRPWMYTAMTRAQKTCVIVGSRSEITKTIQRNRAAGRWTKLKTYVQLREAEAVAEAAEAVEAVAEEA